MFCRNWFQSQRSLKNHHLDFRIPVLSSKMFYAGQCCLTCVCLEDKCPHLCVLGGQWLCVSLSVPVSELPVVSVYVCVGVCIAGLWQCMVLSLVISEHLCGAAVCTVSLCVHQRL